MAALALTACQDRGPTGPDGLLRPAFTHQTVHQGPGFYFISPVPPGNQPVPGVFDDTLSPSVEIWQLDGPNGGVVGTSPVASLTATVSTNPEQYQVSWTNLNELARGYYRIEVRSAPSSETNLFYGSVEVQLVNGGGSGLQVGGNTLPIKFWISVDAGCPPESVCSTVFNGAAQTIVVEEGGAALRFEQNFCARTSPTGDCLEFITVIASRYRGPERCIPDPGFRTPGNAVVPSIQYELCMRVTTIPEDVEFDEQKVFAYMCIDPRADALQHASPADLIRIMSAEEVVSGDDLTAIGQPVKDLTGTAEDLPEEEVLADCDHGVFEEHASAPTSGLGRFAALARSALFRAGRYLAPAPVHARRRANIPIVASPIGFSRIGLVVPIATAFDRDSSTGYPDQLLPTAVQPRVQVLAADTDGVATTVPVPFVQVRFAVTAGGGSVANTVDSTNAYGYVSAQWTLGSSTTLWAHKLTAEVGAPQPLDDVIPIFPNGEPTSQWRTPRTFSATAWPYAVHFLTPLGASGSGLTNVVTTPAPTVRVCGPLADPTDLAECPTPLPQPGAPRLKNNAWETSWNTGKNGTAGARYRIEVRVGGLLTGLFHAERGGGGGSGTLGSETNPYIFQNGSTIPIKFLIVAP